MKTVKLIGGLLALVCFGTLSSAVGLSECAPILLSAAEKEAIIGGLNCCQALHLCSDRACPSDCDDTCPPRLWGAICVHCGPATQTWDCSPGGQQGCATQRDCWCNAGNCYEICNPYDCQTVTQCN